MLLPTEQRRATLLDVLERFMKRRNRISLLRRSSMFIALTSNWLLAPLGAICPQTHCAPNGAPNYSGIKL